MILVDNVLTLRNLYPPLLEFLRNAEQLLETRTRETEVITARSGIPTLVWKQDSRPLYIHSQYDPKNEAEKFVSTLKNVDQYKHVFFYGLGLGYHLEAFFEKYGSKPFTIFEPEVDVGLAYFQTRSFQSLPLDQCRNLYIGYDNMVEHLNSFFSTVVDPVLIVVLPSYERVFTEKTSLFYKRFQERVKFSLQGLVTTLSYEKRWITNSIQNFSKVLETPGIFRINESPFHNKPVILVAAGPSLQEEYENLKFIKENRLAYIIAVGSANKALLKNGIKPDAVTTYDPNPWNYKVYEEIIQDQIDDIPMIFGSSVGSETLDQYPGPKLHMITTQDTISMFLLKRDGVLDNAEVVTDAPSIAVLTMELLGKSGANPIILVGQNLAIKSDQYYPEGIQYSTRSTKVSEAEKAGFIEIESVDGGKVKTIESHNTTRLQLEYTISMHCKKGKVLNTTTGGAKIHGAEYITLDQVIKEFLGRPVVEKKWYECPFRPYNLSYLQQEWKKLETEKMVYNATVDKIIKYLRKLEQLVKFKDRRTIDQVLPKFDKDFKNLMDNEYLKVFLRPMHIAQFDIFVKSIQKIRLEKDALLRARMVLDYFGKLIHDFQAVDQLASPLFSNLENAVKRRLSSGDQTNQVVG